MSFQLPGLKSYIGLLLLQLFTSLNGNGQSFRDSMLQETGHSSTSKEFVNELITLGNQNIFADNAFSKKLAKEAIEISWEVDFPAGEAYALNLLGILEHIEGNNDVSFTYLEKAISICEEIQDIRGLINSHSNLAAVYNDMGQIDKSIESLIVSLEHLQTLDDSLGMGMISSNIGTLFSEIGDWGNAKKYYYDALVCTEGSTDIRLVGGIYNGLGSVYFELDQMDSAMVMLHNARKMVDSPSVDPITYAQTSLVLGDVHFSMNRFESAISEHKKAEKIFNKNKYTRQLHSSRNRLGKDYMALGLMDSAKYFLTQIINADNPNKFILLNAYQAMTRVYIQENDSDSADFYFNEAEVLRSEILNEEKLEQVQELEIKYDTELLKGEIAQAHYEIEERKFAERRKTLWLVIVVLFSVAILVIGLLLYRQYKRKKSQELASMEYQLLKARMNPHFIFNCLSSIRYLYTKDEKEKANNYLTDFATLIRRTLDYTAIHKINISEEVSLLKLYLEMEKLRVDGVFDYEINIDKSVLSEQDLIPPMLLQPLVENAIWHGLLPAKRHGKIVVSFIKEKEGIRCTVSDNGVGYSQEKVRPDSKGMGLIEKRIGRAVEIQTLDPGTAISIFI